MTQFSKINFIRKSFSEHRVQTSSLEETLIFDGVTSGERVILPYSALSQRAGGEPDLVQKQLANGVVWRWSGWSLSIRVITQMVTPHRIEIEFVR